jgi:hypothetical protein
MIFLKDYLYLETCLIRGHGRTGETRLSNFLNRTHQRFLEVEEAAVIWHDTGDRVQAPHMEVRIQDILFAYESEDTGDDILRNLAGHTRDEIEATAHFGGGNRLRISGKVSPRALDFKSARQHNFFVMIQPSLQGFPAGPVPEYRTIRQMPYAIVNMERLSILMH